MAEPQQIDLRSLSIQQLIEQKNAVEEQMSALESGFQQLKTVRERFMNSLQCLGQLEKEEEGTKSMIPLTSSLYVPGTISVNDKVMIDIGTGYYVKKQVSSARETFERKVKYITGNMEKLQVQLVRDQNLVEYIVAIVQEKARLQQQQQQQQLLQAQQTKR